MAAHSSILAWKIPWTEEPRGLQSMGLQRVRHNWATSLSLSFHTSIKKGKYLEKGKKPQSCKNTALKLKVRILSPALLVQHTHTCADGTQCEGGVLCVLCFRRQFGFLTMSLPTRHTHILQVSDPPPSVLFCLRVLSCMVGAKHIRVWSLRKQPCLVVRRQVTKFHYPLVSI